MSDASRMTGEEIGAFSNALCAAFDLASLEIMLRTRLNRRLDTVAGQGPLREVAFRTVDVALREGWERQLVSAACAANPKNPELFQFCREHPHLVDPPPPPPEDGEPEPEKEPVHSWFRRRWWVVAAVGLLLAVAAILIIVDGRPWDRQRGQDSSDGKREPPSSPSGAPKGPRPTRPVRFDDGTDVELVVAAFKELDAQGSIATDAIHLGLWILGPPSHHDLEVVRDLARTLRAANARVVVAGAEDDRLEAAMKRSGFRRVLTGDGKQMLKDPIAAVVYIGLFRNSLLVVRGSKRNQVTPIVDACEVGKDVFVVLSTEDRVVGRRYLGKSAPAATRGAMEAAQKWKRMLYASIPGTDDFKEDFTSFFRAIRERNPRLRGSVELLP